MSRLADLVSGWSGYKHGKPGEYVEFRCPVCDATDAIYWFSADRLSCPSRCDSEKIAKMMHDGRVPSGDPYLRGRGDDEPWAIRSGSDFDAVIEKITSPEWRPPQPTLGMLAMQSDESPRGLFYAGRLNCIYGDGDSGKTLTMLLVSKQEVERGNDVLYLDYEDEEENILGMLIMTLRTSPDLVRAHFHYAEAHSSMTPVSEKAVLSVLDTGRVSLVVIDSTGEALALEKNSDSNNDSLVSQWMRKVPRRLVAHPSKPCVVLIDHLPKETHGFVSSPIGSGRKRNVIRGAQYHQLLQKPFARGMAGYADLICSKDKAGTYTFKQVVGRLQVDAEFELISHDTANEENETEAKVRRLLVERPGIVLGEFGKPESLSRAILDQMTDSGEAIRRECGGAACEWGEGPDPCLGPGANKRVHLYLSASPTSS